MKRRRLLELVPVLLLAGCASRSVPTRWYALRGEPPAPAPAVQAVPADGEVWELSRNLRLPGALDRDTLVVESGHAGLEALVGHRWAEPLRDSVPRLLQQDLARLRGAGRVWAAPAPAGVVVAKRLTVDVLVLQADAARRRLHLHARWWFERVDAPAAAAPAAAASAPAPPAAPMLGETEFDTEIADASVDALAAAHRLALWRLAERVVAFDRLSR